MACWYSESNSLDGQPSTLCLTSLTKLGIPIGQRTNRSIHTYKGISCLVDQISLHLLKSLVGQWIKLIELCKKQVVPRIGGHQQIGMIAISICQFVAPFWAPCLNFLPLHHVRVKLSWIQFLKKHYDCLARLFSHALSLLQVTLALPQRSALPSSTWCDPWMCLYMLHSFERYFLDIVPHNDCGCAEM